MPGIPEPPLVAHRSDEPRRWVELAPMVCRHRPASQGMILTAAAVTEPGSAICLGAGACQELPVAELADTYDDLTLNDLDSELLHRGLADASLGPVQLSKVTTLVADLTGISDEFLQAVDRLLADGDDFAGAIERIAALADAAAPRVFSTGQTYDLVVASCVIGQLHLRACNGTIDRFAARFPAQIQAFRESPRWVGAMYALARRMENVFVDSLHGLVNPTGRIFLSESVQGCFLHPASGGQWKTDGMYRMTHTTELRDYLDDRFHVEHEGRWVWVTPPGPENGQVGRLYKVQGVIASMAPRVA